MKNKITKKSTIRDILQILGTDLLREGFNNNIHVAATIGAIKETDNVIIPDMRFPNELKAIKEKDGISIRVNRLKVYNTDNTIIDYTLANVKNMGIEEHPSETALDHATFDYVIDNDSDINSLIKKVGIILKKEGII